MSFLRKCLWLLPIPLTVVAVNLAVDPAHLVGPYGEERQVARLLLQGRDVAIASNLDERILQKYYIEGLSRRKEVVVLGSSRSMQIGSEIFGDSFFNSSVPGSSIEDFYGLYEIYHRKDILPAKIILCADPWLLNPKNRQTRWKSIRGEAASALGRAGARPVGLEGFPLDRCYELITPSYFQASVESLFRKRGAAEASGEMPDQYVKRRDGRWIYPERIQRATPEEVQAETLEYIRQNPVYSLGDFDRISPALAERFDRFVELVLREGVEVTLFLPPYHPLVYDALVRSDRYRVIVDVENHFRSVAARKSLRLIGSYDPGQAGMTEADFYDGMHPKPEAVQKLFR